MNKVILMGRLAKDPEIKDDPEMMVARYTLAVDRRGQGEADFIQCVAFGKSAQFVDKWLRKGMKMLVTGRIQTGFYTDRSGHKVYTTNVVVEDQEFAESSRNSYPQEAPGFIPIPEDDENTPFK